MEMMNRAIEDASDFMELKRKLMETQEQRIAEMGRHEMLSDLQKMQIAPQYPPKTDHRSWPKQPGENREQYRARIHGKVKA